ncbi:MAG: ATP-binding protein, partial [Acidimicrobiales bacterium]
MSARAGTPSSEATEMLKRIRVRSKLLLLLAAPVVALVVLAGSIAVDRFQTAEDLRGDVALARLADAGSDVATAVAIEHFRSVLSGQGGVDAELDEARAATDAALEIWSQQRIRAEELGHVELNEAMAHVAEAAATDLVAFRRQIDSVALAPATINQFQPLGDSLLLQDQAITAEIDDIDVFRSFRAQASLAGALAAASEIANSGAISILEPSVAPIRVVLVAQAFETLGGELEELQLTVDPEVFAELESSLDMSLTFASFVDRGERELLELVARLDRDTSLAEWIATSEARLDALNTASGRILAAAAADVEIVADEARSDAEGFVVFTGAITLITLLLAAIVARSISRPLRRLTFDARRLADEELPALVETLRSGTSQGAADLSPIDTRGRDEIAQLAGAVADIQQMTVEVAEEQGELLRRGISDIFVNLARRNQSLLDRQIDFIDRLESREENADVLENLFRLDHLATRMRRNAESLLVLAGAEPTRRRGEPVAMVDVVRVAADEIEDFGRIEMLSVESVFIAGSVAIDIAHLLSELMENASQFSPPDAAVEVMGHRTEDGGYQLHVSDRGIGMPAEQLAAANALLSRPPVVGLELGRSLGFTVVSRLAHRLGLTVRLTSSSHGGVTAVIAIPAAMIAESAAGEVAPEGGDGRPASFPRESVRQVLAHRVGREGPQPEADPTPADTERPVAAKIADTGPGVDDPLFDLGRRRSEDGSSPLEQLARMMDLGEPDETEPAPPPIPPMPGDSGSPTLPRRRPTTASGADKGALPRRKPTGSTLPPPPARPVAGS